MSSMVDVRIERTPETHMGDLSEIDSDFEAWSLMAMSPSPLPRQHSRLIADSQIDIQDIFQGLGNSMLSFESPPSNRQYARHSRRKHVSKLSIVSRVLWMMVLLASCIWFWLLFQKRFERVEANRTASFENDETQQLQFFSASNKYIRVRVLATISVGVFMLNCMQYIGRWTAVEGNDRIDGSFPGECFSNRAMGRPSQWLTVQRGILRVCSGGHAHDPALSLQSKFYEWLRSWRSKRKTTRSCRVFPKRK